MDVFLLLGSGYFNAGYYGDVGTGAGCLCGGFLCTFYAGNGIVVRKGKNRYAGVLRQRNQFFGRTGAVGMVGMYVKVNHRNLL